MNLWMRWVNFQALRDMLLIVAASSEGLRANELIRRTAEAGILLGRGGQQLRASTHYHHRNALEHLGLMKRVDHRYSVDTNLKETLSLIGDKNIGQLLTESDKEAFASVVLRNQDCRKVFFNHFLPPDSVCRGTGDLVRFGHPIEMRITKEQTILNGKTTQSRQVRIRGKGASEWVVIPGTPAVQAIHYGLRVWGVGQLGFLDELYHSNGIYTIYPIHLARTDDDAQLVTMMVQDLLFDDDWTVVRVQDFALRIGIQHHAPFRQPIDILNVWMNKHRDIIAPIPTNERFITAGLSKTERELALKGFLRESTGTYVSHLRIHRSLVDKVLAEVQNRD